MIVILIVIVAGFALAFFLNYSSNNSNNSTVPILLHLIKKTEEQEAQDYIDEFKDLSPYKAKKLFYDYKDAGIHFPGKAYAFIQAKINGEVFFTDDEFNKRIAEGKPTAYITPEYLVFEKASEIILSKELSFDQKIADVKPFIDKHKGIRRSEFAFTLYTTAILKTMEFIDEEKAVYLKSEKNKITRLFNKGELTALQIPFENIHNALVGEPFITPTVLLKKPAKKKNLDK